MLKVMLIGGTKTDAIIETLGDTKYSITKKFNFIEEAFDDIMENSGEFLDIDTVIILQYGFKSDVEILDQIRSIQEAMIVCGMTSKLYFILKDIEKYEECKNVGDIILYDHARIIYLTRIHTADITRAVQGEFDGQGIYNEVSSEDEEYTEDILREDVGEEKPKHFTNVEDELEEEIEEEEIEEKKPSGLFRFNRKPKEVESKSDGGEVIGGNILHFKGIIGVTGDRNMGVSSVSCNIAEYFADMGRTVLLLDMDLKRKSQSLLYSDFKEEKQRFTNTQLGVLTVLNNPDLVEDVLVVVKDNLALIGSSRDPEFNVREFANKPLDKVVNDNNIISFLGVAKGLFDVVILDCPLDMLKKHMQFSIIVDRFLVCVENTFYAVDNLFKVCFGDMLDIDTVITKSILDKTDIILTKFTEGSIYKNHVINEEIVEEFIRGNIYNRIKVLGRISYNNVFQKQMSINKRAIDLNDDVRNEIRSIVNKIYYR